METCLGTTTAISTSAGTLGSMQVIPTTSVSEGKNTKDDIIGAKQTSRA